MAQAIVMKFGMSDKVGTVLHKDEDLQNLSPQTRMAIENEIKALIDVNFFFFFPFYPINKKQITQ